MSDLAPVRHPEPPEVRAPRWRLTIGPERLTAIVGGVAIITACLGFFVFASLTSPDTWVPVMVVVLLMATSAPIIILVSGRPPDRRIRKLLLLGLIIKLLCTGPRYYLNEVYYKGEGDAARYHQAGSFLVQNMRDSGKFSIEGAELTNFPTQTQVVGYVTGTLYLAFGTSFFGGYLVFSWVAWLGLIMFCRSFQIAFPNAPPYRAYACILLFPSLVFWPSSIGKEAVMVALLGLLTLGVARLLTGSKPILGVVWIACSGLLIGQIRPHLLVVAAIALMASAMASPKRDVTRRGAVFRLFLVVLMIPVMVSAIGRMDTVMGTSGGGSQSLQDQLNENLERTSIGGSAFLTAPVQSPVDLPYAIVTVLYRPFLFEASNVAVLLSAAEGTLLIIMTIIGARWLWRIGPAMYRSPFAAFCGAFTVAFVVAFSSIGNAGILSRQRVQVYPLVMLLACAAYEHARTHRRVDDDAPDHPESVPAPIAPSAPAPMMVR